MSRAFVLTLGGNKIFVGGKYNKGILCVHVNVESMNWPLFTRVVVGPKPITSRGPWFLGILLYPKNTVVV